MPKGVPAAAEPGCVVKASCAAAAGLTAMAVEVVLVKPLLVNSYVDSELILKRQRTLQEYLDALKKNNAGSAPKDK